MSDILINVSDKDTAAKPHLHLPLPLAVSLQSIAELLVGAFESSSGSGYWISNEREFEYTQPTVDPILPILETGGIYAKRHGKRAKVWERYDWPLQAGGSVVFYEGRENTRQHFSKCTLNLDAIKRGLGLFPFAEGGHFGDWLDGNSDACTSDVFLQLCVLGKVKYG